MRSPVSASAVNYPRPRTALVDDDMSLCSMVPILSRNCTRLFMRINGQKVLYLSCFYTTILRVVCTPYEVVPTEYELQMALDVGSVG